MRSMTSDTYWTMASQRWRMAIVNFRVVRRNDDELYMDILQCNCKYGGETITCVFCMIWTFCSEVVNMEKEVIVNVELSSFYINSTHTHSQFL